ncbi:hypothetical protein C0J52_21291 [Blattella germanica]|nr:hypothetical protein C0J52_21291 [Blattella germanica]
MESLLHNDKGEMESLLNHDMLQQQEARYYQNVPEVAVNFTIPPSAPPPQYEAHNWQPTLVKEKRQQVVDKANWFGIFLAFMSGAFFTLSSAAVKALKSMDPMELLIIRTTLQCWFRGWCHVGTTVLHVQKTSFGRCNHDHLQFASVRYDNVVPIPPGALRILPDTRRVPAPNRSSPYLQTTLHLPGKSILL